MGVGRVAADLVMFPFCCAWPSCQFMCASCPDICTDLIGGSCPGLYNDCLISRLACRCSVAACVPILFPGLCADLISRPACRSSVPVCVPTQRLGLRADPASRPACRSSVPACVPTQRPGLRADPASRPACRSSVPACVLIQLYSLIRVCYSSGSR
ncbi:hypothetical protein ZIOFF_022547 [Zingiber officinale]|uniref:Uncharacterized protein n=1 Tax=Zingiber officinale TaxID=94328 RepID=A0A8J5H327_ZINOF|nr:hypothetical protein ZIOFF_022547 [Zingiber officinale]